MRILTPHLSKLVEYYWSYAHLNECTSLLVFLLISAWLMSSFVLVLTNYNKEKLILIVLFNKRKIKEQIMVISRFTVPWKAFTQAVKSDKINEVLKKLYFGHDMRRWGGPYNSLMTIAGKVLLQLILEDALNQVSKISSKILNWYVPMWCQNTRK